MHTQTKTDYTGPLYEDTQFSLQNNPSLKVKLSQNVFGKTLDDSDGDSSQFKAASEVSSDIKEELAGDEDSSDGFETISEESMESNGHVISPYKKKSQAKPKGKVKEKYKKNISGTSDYGSEESQDEKSQTDIPGIKVTDEEGSGDEESDEVCSHQSSTEKSGDKLEKSSSESEEYGSQESGQSSENSYEEKESYGTESDLDINEKEQDKIRVPEM